MSLESGGRADKYGNEYENRYLARLFLRLVNEEITSVTVEPLGLDGDGVEFITTYSDGTNAYYQCKASNTTHNAWSVADLKRYKVFERSRTIIERVENSRYFFISPLQYNGLDELCKRARTNMSAQDFITYQLSNAPLRATFDDCAASFNFNKEKPEELKRLHYVLAHCYFEQSPTGVEAEQDLNEHVGMVFTGSADSTRVLLETYANNTGRYGVKITAKEIVDYLDSLGVYLRNYRGDDRILARISALNEIYWGVYQPIKGRLLRRATADILIEKYNAGHSIIIHGKAGSGKSGCIQEFINYLNDTHILYLGIKLDKDIPDISADAYGKNLGLPESPVYCLNTLSVGEPCVLILDQLDSLRWTSKHSAKALDVCKELISQAVAVNKYQGGKISIIFVSRTFDLENDKGLQSLFADNEKSHSLVWDKISVDIFSEKEVSQIVGPDYNAMPTRLKKLLQVPSSLYVWSQLEKSARSNVITSVYQLMDVWWNQVQTHCELIGGIPRTEARLCKDAIVLRMDENAVLSLPIQLFADYQKVIDGFVSNGLLVKSQNKVSFTHQSFLDYFIAAQTLANIYSGRRLSDLLGLPKNQIPTLRYRLLIILQTLLDSDISMFIQQCKYILDTDSVRYYFQCAVFEIIGQCTEPGEIIFNFVQIYLHDPKWNEYILQTVYYGHPAFVMHLNVESEYNWLENKSLILLKSVSDKVPDFVVDVLRPYAFVTAADDRKIFLTLCQEASNDSDRMFQFRLELLAHLPELFNEFWGFSSLFEHQSTRAVTILKYLLKESVNRETDTLDIYWGETEQISTYFRKNCKTIIESLFLDICEATSNLSSAKPFRFYNDEYRRWIAHELHESNERKIVEFVKISFEEYAQKHADNAIRLIKSLEYPISIVGHELVMYTAANLPIEYCDEVIQWLLTDFEKKVFEYTSNKSDFLSCTKTILKMFSLHCSMDLFRQLEKKICMWKDDSEEMVRIYKHRIETNQEHKWEPMYYAYWGHFQKELLPAMEYTRLSHYAKELIRVLNRNSWIYLPHYYSGFSCGPAKNVISPISGYTARISDKCWLKIISTPNEKINNHWRGDDDETNPYYIEATHESFSASLANQARLQPTRFAKLALKFPQHCYRGYVTSVLYALADYAETDEKPDVELMSEVIRRYSNDCERNIAAGIVRLIEKHAEISWPDDIIDTLNNFALKHPDPKADEYVVTRRSDPEDTSCDSLLSNSINCVRGCSLQAIAALLWKHRELSELFKSTIYAASSDANAAVRFAVVSCILPYYNFDQSFSAYVLNKLLSMDLRILAAPGCWEILSRQYQNEPDYYRERLIEACRTPIEDLAVHAAGLLCAVAIFFQDEKAFSHLTNERYSAKQEERICRQASSTFNQKEYHELSQEILMHLIETSTSDLKGISRLFHDRCIVIHRDKAFLISLMQSKMSSHLVHTFLRYLRETNEDIREYADVLEAVGQSAAEVPQEWNRRLAVSDLIQCVIHLFDIGKDDFRIRNICLDIWDDLFRSNLQDIRSLSDMMDNFE
ncbi:NACHT domain-containing protein [Bacilliculturomica massiliensis]|uniref:hypothetical protein n=1 Tax=Bacilliculturomica massiliensis TaxID=1917867 RepID=UPI001031630F|nr:hypothetical protein [Bacilliculturomica massiliensis]